MASKMTVVRIQQDIAEVNSCDHMDMTPILAVPQGDRLDTVDCLIVGPPETPYEYGFFRFRMTFPSTYPNEAPKVIITSTDSGRLRFNPNLYATGKVCLSILGTWRGEATEQWRATYSVAYILRVIQALIMNSEPFANEPGQEANGHSKEGLEYIDKISHETIREAVCNQLERALDEPDPSEFEAFIKHQFLIRYDCYINKVRRMIDSRPELEGKQFPVFGWEYTGNVCSGSYKYTELLGRLQALKQRLEDQFNQLRIASLDFKSKLAYRRQYDQLTRDFQEFETHEVEIDGITVELINSNPFNWSVTFIVPDGNEWAGGVFNAELLFDGEYSEPYVRFTSRIFHPQVTNDGYLLYQRPDKKRNLIQSILIQIFKIFTKPPNTNPVSWLNTEAARLCFSQDAEIKRDYRRQVSRCVRESLGE